MPAATTTAGTVIEGASAGAPSSAVSEESTREARILDAARHLFRVQAYGDVSLDAVAEAAGVARGLINHYFKNKRGLYLEVVRHVTAVEAFPVPEYVNGANPEDRLVASLNLWLETIEQDRELWVDSVRASSLGDTEIAALIENAREAGALRIVTVLGIGPAERLSPEVMGMLRGWVGFCEAVVVQWLMYERLDGEQVRQLIVDTLMPGALRLTAT